MAQSGIQPDPSCFRAFQLIKTGFPVSAADTFKHFETDLATDEATQQQFAKDLAELDTKSTKKFIKFVMFKLSNAGDKIIVSYISKSEDYEDFVKRLPEDECRWAVYDMTFDTKDGQRSKLVFFSWTPDKAKVKNKMMYASSKQALKSIFTGIHNDIQATDFDDVQLDAVVDKIK
ncbi:cofilin [Spiromyces aspiralis]|uniref:Cofilin n=1 Tax=Spiromyces aspiralis TaxID=68401 RepID=A0ACC1HKK0_9FUNG|nr:cofilin [Spiromyces aspiralis]